MSKHTQGPWEVFQNEVAPTVPYIKSKTGMVAALFGKGGEEQHNAKLIAAAPELLEVLGDLEMLFDAQTYDEIKRADFDPPDDHEFTVNITSKQLRAISAVLLKAGA